jgi:hypothetical protein
MNTDKFLQLMFFIIGWILVAPPALVTAQENEKALYMFILGTLLLCFSFGLGMKDKK